jgi:hypothetical protein
MLQLLVERYGAWRVHKTGCEVLGFPPTWDITRRQAGEIEQVLRLENDSLLWAVEFGVL